MKHTNVVLFIISSLFCFVILELSIRLIGHVDDRGQFYFIDYPILPYKLDLTLINKLPPPKNDNKERIIYDQYLGWTNNPSFRHSGGINALYKINIQGLRGDREYSEEPASDTLRIAMFGDSYTFSAEVGNNETWGYYLEEALTQADIRNEVLNFGVSGYGMDQAYLRWQLDGKNFHPDIVLFGFSPHDINRNINLFRFFIDPAVRAAKPRFIIENDELVLIHQPVTPPTETVEVLSNFDNHPLKKYEGYYDSRWIETFWLQSKLLAVITTFLSPSSEIINAGSYTPEANELSKRIVTRFGDDVTADESEFIVVHLPGKIHLNYYLEHGTLSYYPILEQINQKYPVWYFESSLNDANESYWKPQTHYSRLMNQLLADFTSKSIIQCLDDNSCLPQRFTNNQLFRVKH